MSGVVGDADDTTEVMPASSSAEDVAPGALSLLALRAPAQPTAGSMAGSMVGSMAGFTADSIVGAEDGAEAGAEATDARSDASPSVSNDDAPDHAPKFWCDMLWLHGAVWRHIYHSTACWYGPEPVCTTGVFGTLTAASVANIIHALAPTHTDVFIDIGVGHGAMLGAMHVLKSTVELRGIDSEPAMVNAARRNLALQRAPATLSVGSIHNMQQLGDDVTLAFS